MSILLDTNILLRGIQAAHEHHEPAKKAVKLLLDRGERVCLVPQNLYEFWSAITRPADQNGLDISVTTAAALIAEFKQLFTVLDDTPAVRPEWERLVIVHRVIGRTAHDARLVAAMLVHGLTHILTFNTGDFKRFPGITVLDPTVVAASLP